ncbi:MAG: 2-dehydro-3-deoxygluconokinase [Clostridiales bacterium]|nr:2-dehydro-3-deoxygluconokinase [Clostridiales bacterium]
MPELVTLGETMAVFNPASSGPLQYIVDFKRLIGGAESNVAIGVSRLGHSAGWISRLGDDPFGRFINNFIRGEGVDTSRVVFDEMHPTGVYFKEIKAGGDVTVYYYRKGSAASTMSPADLDEDYIKNARILHVSGITPALSDNCRETVFKAMEIAKVSGVTISFDPNIRLKLWSGRQAAEVLKEMARYADIVLPGIDEGEIIFGSRDPKTIAEEFLKLGASTVAVKLGKEGAMAATRDEEIMSPAFDAGPVIDTVGAGDAFASGFLTGILEGMPLEQAVGLANTCGGFATTIVGDVEGLPSRKEIEALTGNKRLIER